MEKLYLKTKDENILIEDEIIRKYHLKAGMHSPFTRYLVVNEYGQGQIERAENEDPSNQEFNSRNAEPVFTTSESIDIAQGVDSAVEGNKQ